jgi:hypothetical protein
VLAYAVGTIAALPVLATLVLLAIDGHPEGLLCVVAGVGVPFLLSGAWGLARHAHIQLWFLEADRARNPGQPAATDQEVTAMAELTVIKVPLEEISAPSPSSRPIEVRLVWT